MLLLYSLNGEKETVTKFYVVQSKLKIISSYVCIYIGISLHEFLDYNV